MTSVRITRLFVDPITFRETIGLVYLPRIEDTFLDDQLAAGSYALPGKMSLFLPPTSKNKTQEERSERPPLPAPSLPHGETGKSDEYRPPTPPKVRDMAANSPRKSKGIGSPHRSPSVKMLPSPLKAKVLGMSPFAKTVSESASDTSISELGALVRSPLVVQALANISSLAQRRDGGGGVGHHDPKQKHSVRFADEVELHEISILTDSLIGDLFYGSADLADFRYDAFVEEGGLDTLDFD